MNTCRSLISKNANILSFFRHGIRNISGGLYEPPYLEAMKSKIPIYDALNIQIRGYDYPVVESYQKFVHHILTNMEIDVEESWALPPQHMSISTYKPNSELINAKYLLKIYNRTIQITDVLSTQLPLIMRAIEASQPAGVTVHIRPHEESDEDDRYIPDLELNTLKQELEEMGGPSKKKS